MQFPIPPGCSLCVKAIGTHGLTDALCLRTVPVYAITLCAPIHPRVLVVAFALSSMHHFSNDVGAIGSLLLHTLLGAAAAAGAYTEAFQTLCGFMLAVHIPNHIRRTARMHGAIKTWTTLVIGAVCSVPCLVGQITERMQRVVVAHVLCNDVLFCTGQNKPNEVNTRWKTERHGSRTSSVKSVTKL